MDKVERTKDMIKKCYILFKNNDIWSDDQDTLRRNFKDYALKNHPDKGGNHDLFSYANACNDILKNDFEYFKIIAKQSDIQIPKRSESLSKPSTSYSQKHTYEKFMQKKCESKRGGWTKVELQEMCKDLNIKFHTKDDKQELCNQISNYFKRNGGSDDTESKKKEKQKEIKILKEQMMKEMSVILQKEQQLKLEKESLQKKIDQLLNLEREFK